MIVLLWEQELSWDKCTGAHLKSMYFSSVTAKRLGSLQSGGFFMIRCLQNIRKKISFRLICPIIIQFALQYQPPVQGVAPEDNRYTMHFPSLSKYVLHDLGFWCVSGRIWAQLDRAKCLWMVMILNRLLCMDESVWIHVRHLSCLSHCEFRKTPIGSQR